MSVVFTAFYAEPKDCPSRIDEYLRYINAGQKALAATNHSAKYLVLTDRRSAPLLEPHVDIGAVVADDPPLMVKYLLSQLQYERSAKSGMTILAAADCLANRNLDSAIPTKTGFATTFNKAFKINNVAYVRDHNLAVWFLARALDVLKTWPSEKQEWLGDQESWDAVLGYWQKRGDPPFVSNFASNLGTRRIHLYPCSTHNSFIRLNGKLKREQDKAYLLHFKGPRKEFLEQHAERIVNRAGNSSPPVRVDSRQ